MRGNNSLAEPDFSFDSVDFHRSTRAVPDSCAQGHELDFEPARTSDLNRVLVYNGVQPLRRRRIPTVNAAGDHVRERCDGGKRTEFSESHASECIRIPIRVAS